MASVSSLLRAPLSRSAAVGIVIAGFLIATLGGAVVQGRSAPRPYLQGTGSITTLSYSGDASEVRGTPAGTVALGCNGDGTFSVELRAEPDAAVFWVDDGGNVVWYNLATTATQNLTPLDYGTRHLAIHARIGTAVTVWDLWLVADDASLCQISGTELTLS
jgi:hypothetical protein